MKATPSQHTESMTSGAPARSILKFAVPLILGYLLQQMYLIIDAAIVGRWIGVGASSSIMFLIMGLCNGACAGFAIPVAQAFGAGDHHKMRCYVSNAGRIAVVLALVATLLSCLFCEKILQLVNTPADVFHDAYVFLFLQFCTIPFTIAYNLYSGQIRALGNSKEPFYFLIASSFLNILLDVVFILLLGMGVEGAGFATFLSQAFASWLCRRFIRRRLTVLVPKGDERAFNNKKISILLNNGVPMGLQFSITAVGIIMLQSANNALGTVYVASFTAAIRIKYLFTCVLENIGVAMATYCGQNIGARRLDRVKTGVRDAMGIMMVYFVLTVAVIYPFADEMMMLFVKGGDRQCGTADAHLQLVLPRTGRARHPAVQHPGPRLQQPEHDERRDGDDRPLRREPLAGASMGVAGCLLCRPGGMDDGRPLPRPRLPVAAETAA